MAAGTKAFQRDLGKQHAPLTHINSRVVAAPGWMLLEHHNLLPCPAEIQALEQQFADSFLYPSYFALLANHMLRVFSWHTAEIYALFVYQLH